jgi:hypothetical protein
MGVKVLKVYWPDSPALSSSIDTFDPKATTGVVKPVKVETVAEIVVNAAVPTPVTGTSFTVLSIAALSSPRHATAQVPWTVTVPTGVTVIAPGTASYTEFENARLLLRAEQDAGAPVNVGLLEGTLPQCFPERLVGEG